MKNMSFKLYTQLRYENNRMYNVQMKWTMEYKTPIIQLVKVYTYKVKEVPCDDEMDEFENEDRAKEEKKT